MNYEEGFDNEPTLIDGFDEMIEVVEVDPEFQAELDKAEESETDEGANHYIDKAELQRALVEWFGERDKAAAEDRPMPDVPKYIQRCIIKICEKTSTRWNFVNYPFREEMVGDAIENIIKYIDRYDINNPKQNPFGYWSFVAWRAMVRRIKAEKTRAAQHYQYVMNSGVLDSLELQSHDDSEEYTNMVQHYQMNVNDSLATYAQPKPRKKSAKKSNVVDVESMLND